MLSIRKHTKAAPGINLIVLRTMHPHYESKRVVLVRSWMVPGWLRRRMNWSRARIGMDTGWVKVTR